MDCVKSARVPHVARSLALLAGVTVGVHALPALGQAQGRLLVGTEQGHFSGLGGSARVKVYACPSDGAWSPASGEFDVIASSGGWYGASGGQFAMGDGSVRFVSYALPPAPLGSTPGPVQVWDGELRAETLLPRLIRVDAVASAMSVYPTPSAGPVAVAPVGASAHILANPMSFGPALVAPGEGTSIQTGPTGLVATPSGPQPVLIALLLPAVQKVRVDSPQPPTDLTIEFRGQATSDDFPTESLTLGYTKATWGHGAQAQASGGGDYTACFVGASGVWICLIDNQPTIGGLVVERVPDVHTFEIDRDPATGRARTTATLEWDQPVAIRQGTFAGQTVRLRIAVAHDEPIPGLVKTGAGTLVLSSSDAPMMNVTLQPGCRADLTTTAVAGASGYGMPDGHLGTEDFFYFLAQYAAGNVGVGDLTASATPGTPGHGTPDLALNSEDFFFYLSLFAGGC